jgi:hypothetical protein
MPTIDRRTLLQWLATAPLAAGFTWSEAEAARAAQRAAAAPAGTPFAPSFFSAHEYATVRMLVDLIIPRDERSGSATDAGVPEFIDFLLADEPTLPQATLRQTAMRGGLAWIDLECQRRFDARFVDCRDEQRLALLDDISQPPEPDEDDDLDVATPNLVVVPRAHGRAFFASVRDLTAAGFWSSRVGVADLQYTGNRSVADWTGCPDEALAKLGVRYPPA